MDEKARERFLSRFAAAAEEVQDLSGKICMEIEVEQRSLVGFCVMGGIFSEGIDLKGESLIGAIIVGTGVPQVCREREILKEYFDSRGEEGVDYAYRYPGMNKVLQAAGRVIRTIDDKGVVALLDNRFELPVYQRMFPREWEKAEWTNMETVGESVRKFWDKI